MKFFALVGLGLCLCACGIDTKKKPAVSTSAPKLTQDSDGDGVTDTHEKAMGRDPLMADIPRVALNFASGYKITFHYRSRESGEEGHFVVDTTPAKSSSDYQKSVGIPLMRQNILQEAARIGRYRQDAGAVQTWQMPSTNLLPDKAYLQGEVPRLNLSRVLYPLAPAQLRLKTWNQYRPFFDPQNFELTEATIEVNNTLTLSGDTVAIKNPILHYHIRHPAEGTWELVDSIKLSRTLHRGDPERVAVKLSVPPLMLQKNWFATGELILVTLEDFEISSLKITRKTLMGEVRKKSLPVVVSTPLEYSVRYLALGDASITFAQAMQRLFGENYKMEADRIQKIHQLESNLPLFTHLQEVKDQHKKGRWFVLTGKIEAFYLDHHFQASDFIALAWLTGQELASQREQSIFQDYPDADSTAPHRYSLGEVSLASKVDLYLSPKQIWGESKRNQKEIVTPNSCDNCAPLNYTCQWETNFYTWEDRPLTFAKDFSGELARIRLRLNDQSISLADGVQAEKMFAHWFGRQLHLSIPNLKALFSLSAGDHTTLSLELGPFEASDFNGLKLNHWSGPHGHTACPMGAAMNSKELSVPLSTASKNFNTWMGSLIRGPVKTSGPKNYRRDFSVAVTSLIERSYN